MQTQKQKPWEKIDHAEIEARMEAAKQLRRDELLPWIVNALRGVAAALPGVGARVERPAPHRN